MPSNKAKLKARAKKEKKEKKENDTLSNRECKALDELQADWRCTPQSLLSPWTAGSSFTFPVAEFGDAHYKQEDISLNSALWDLWPVAPPDEYEEVLKQAEAKRDRLLPPKSVYNMVKENSFDATKLKITLPHAERMRIASMVRLIQEVHTSVNAAGWLNIDTLGDGMPPLQLLYTRQIMHDVTPLDKAVECAKRLQKEGDLLAAKARLFFDAGDEDEPPPVKIPTSDIHALAGAAVGKYCAALCSLWPWTASGLIMTPEVAFGSGLAQLESELWYCIGACCAILQEHEKRPDRALRNGTEFSDVDGIYFLLLGRLANLVPIDTCYVPYNVLYRSLKSAAVFGGIFTSMSEAWEKELVHGAVLSERCVPGAGNSPDAWAHATCDLTHKGCFGFGFTAQQKKVAPAKIEEAAEERLDYMTELLNNSRWEILPDSDSEKEDEDEEWHFDKTGKKKSGPQAEYTVGGCVQTL